MKTELAQYAIKDWENNRECTVTLDGVTSINIILLANRQRKLRFRA